MSELHVGGRAIVQVCDVVADMPLKILRLLRVSMIVGLLKESGSGSPALSAEALFYRLLPRNTIKLAKTPQHAP